MPVVYITQYDTADGADQEYTNYDAPGGARRECHCTYGVGRAVIGTACPHRQRKAMAERRCSVCGVRMSPGGRVVFLSIAGPSEVPGYAQPMLFSYEAAAHPLCAAYSALACPVMYDSAPQVRVAVTGRYALVDAVQHVLTETLSVVPHNHPRGKLYALGLYVAVCDPAHTRVAPLVDWLATDAPNPYRRTLA